MSKYDLTEEEAAGRRGAWKMEYLQRLSATLVGTAGILAVQPIKRLILMSILTLLPIVASAQSQVSKIDCSAYHKNIDRLWTIMHENVMIVDGKSITINMTMACCFGSDSKRLILGGVNIITIVEKFCF